MPLMKRASRRNQTYALACASHFTCNGSHSRNAGNDLHDCVDYIDPAEVWKSEQERRAGNGVRIEIRPLAVTNFESLANRRVAETLYGTVMSQFEVRAGFVLARIVRSTMSFIACGDPGRDKPCPYFKLTLPGELST